MLSSYQFRKILYNEQKYMNENEECAVMWKPIPLQIPHQHVWQLLQEQGRCQMLGLSDRISLIQNKTSHVF